VNKAINGVLGIAGKVFSKGGLRTDLALPSTLAPKQKVRLQDVQEMSRGMTPTRTERLKQDLGESPMLKPLQNQRGSIGFGDDLPMDTQSRMQRAREQGFDVDNPVYHGTAAKIGDDFFFDSDKIGMQGTSEGYGHYFTSDKDTAKGYMPEGGSMFEGYLKVNNPIDVNQGSLTYSEIKKTISDMVDRELKDYGEEIDSYRDGFMSNYVDTYSLDRETAIDEVAKSIMNGSDRAVDQIAEMANAYGAKEPVMRSVYKATGYDGIKSKGFGDRDWETALSLPFIILFATSSIAVSLSSE